MATTASILVHALDRASALAASEIPARRGEPTSVDTMIYLDNVTTQIAQVQAWLHQHPELLHVLDNGIRQEVRKMERRVNLVNVLTNLGFTVLGTILGLLIPLVLSHLH